MVWFSFLKRKKRVSPISLVEKGDIVHVNSAYTEEVRKCKVENNDPEDRKIFLAVDYDVKTNRCYELRVFDYGDSSLRNFKVLNIMQKTANSELTAEQFLNSKLEIAIVEEKYEVAEKLKKAIEILK